MHGTVVKNCVWFGALNPDIDSLDRLQEKEQDSWIALFVWQSEVQATP